MSEDYYYDGVSFIKNNNIVVDISKYTEKIENILTYDKDKDEFSKLECDELWGEVAYKYYLTLI